MLEHLRPESVFRHFEEISAIPHGSRHTKAISDYCAEFARAHNLPCKQDANNNLIVIAPAAPGYEDAETMILQGHLDMVCEKESWSPLDMEKDPLQLRMDGDFISAHGTTLGGDDGIAVAMMLAVLEDTTLPHPRLECVFTTDEEIGMLGAAALDVSALRGRRMLNLDSEVEGVFTVGCAGGCTAVCSVTPHWQSASDAGNAVHISVRGLTGGHSGTEIHRGRANANILLGRILRELGKSSPLRLVHVGGGKKDNAIPVSADAEIVTPEPLSVKRAVGLYAQRLREEFASTDPGLTLEATDSVAIMCMDADSTERIIKLLSSAPNGVQSMNPDRPDFVRTSLNLGILHTEPQAVTASFCVRSDDPREKQALLERLRALATPPNVRRKLKRAVPDDNGAFRVSGDYPAWTYQSFSPLRSLCAEVFEELYHDAPKIEAIHAGLECGYFADKIRGLDCVSLGPDILDIHTPRERLRISSVQRVWQFLLEVLRRA